jgi:beta propeller repeat protein
VIEVYYRDIDTSDPAVTVNTVVPASYSQWYPAVSDGVIVWSEERGGATGWDIYGFDTANAAAGPFVICDEPGDQEQPDISGDIVVWQEYGDIWAVDLTEIDDPFQISTGGSQLPAVSGNVVVWQWGTDGSFDIRGATLTKVVPSSLIVTAPTAGDMYLANTQIEVQWQLTGSTQPDFVKVEFSSDSGLTWQEVVPGVSFADLQYIWTSIPDVNEINTCQIQVSDTTGEVDSGQSGIFSIFQCDAALTADLTGDCFVDIADIAELSRQWLTCGNPYDEDWCFE